MEEKFLNFRLIMKLIILIPLCITNYILLPNYLSYIRNHQFSLGFKTDNLLTLGFIIPLLIISLLSLIITAHELLRKNASDHSWKQALVIFLVYFILCFAPSIRMISDTKCPTCGSKCLLATKCQCEKDKDYCNCVYLDGNSKIERYVECKLDEDKKTTD